MSRRSMQRSRNATGSARWILLLLAVGVFLVAGVCCGGYTLVSRLLRNDRGAVGQNTTVPAMSLSVAYSPEKAVAFNALVEGFNASSFQTPNGEIMRVIPVELDPETMVDSALDGSAQFQAMSPDSSVWLGQLDEAWSQKQGGEGAQLVGETVRYAVSPVVIAMWEDLARQMGWPNQPIGWQDLLARAQADSNFRWSHPSTSSASGLLATLAEFYAGAGKTRGLTIEDVQLQSTLDYVAALEKTVRYYGEGNEPAIIDQALKEGRSFLDAFVVQEQMVVHYNTARTAAQDRLVAIYPAEGALWEDHPLALLETAGLSTYQRQVFAKFRDYLLSPEAQQLVLRNGYRPADLSIELDGPGSPLTAANGVNPEEPKTALQVPNASVIGVVRNVWWYTKRHTNVFLVVDTSGSMRGDKLAQAQEALGAFLGQIEGDLERVGMVQFASTASVRIALDELGTNRANLQQQIDSLQAGGDTALLDGVYIAFQKLQALGDTERINAIVAMTDGNENNSTIDLRTLVRRLQTESDVPVVIFCIAYGSDADMATLQAIAEPTGGQVREGSPETIRDLYKLLSTYF